jgi:hypothetical protein
MVLYTGKPLELAEVTKAFSTVAAEDLGTASLALRHTAVAAARLNAIAAYELRAPSSPLALPEDWLEEVACELSNAAGLTLWVTSCDEAVVGGYALFDDGEELERGLGDPDSYAAVPNAAASKLAGGKHKDIDVAALFARDLEDEDVPLWLIAEHGVMLEKPRKLLRGEHGNWKPIL